MIIDCHGHYTVEPKAFMAYREAQLAAFAAGGPLPEPPHLTDSALAEPLWENQLRLMDERGIDLTIFSPRAAGMGHHLGDGAVARAWARASNDLVYRAARLFPGRFAPACQLPQRAGEPLDDCIAELRRCVGELGFIGCNLNPDPSGGHWRSPPLTDRYWYPLYDALAELDVPAMIHVSGSCNPAFHHTGAHYLNADTTAFMQLLQGDLFADFPTLRVIIPHGGGAVPYHWGRYRGLAQMLGKPPLSEHLMRNVFFDSCVYHLPGIELLCGVIDHRNVLFGSEMVGAVRGTDPETGHAFDDTRRMVELLDLPADQRQAVFAGNALSVYPRLRDWLG
jgi:4-oxalmesaconate hydratase